MKIWLFSDLHLEFDEHYRFSAIPDADVCVVVGDIMNGCGNMIAWLAQHIAPHMPVVCVAGNHEFYGHSVFEGLEWARHHADAHRDVHFLEQDSVVLAGVRFLGTTLWTDYALDGDAPEDIAWAMAYAEGRLNDHRAIAWRHLPVYEAFTAARARALHVRAKGWIERHLQQSHDGATVVVTHHAPHPLSVNRRFKGSALNPAFASDLTNVIERGQPALWVHGHMHDSCDYRIGNTRVLCNPKGYGGENPAFDAALVVEV